MATKRLFEREGSWLWEYFWDDGWPVVLIFFVFFFWLIIPYYLFKWIYKYIYVPFDDKKEMEQLKEVAAEEKTKADNELEVLTQSLRDAAPKTPPDKMRATILLNTVQAQPGTFQYTVDMMVELSEQERAMVQQHRLEFVEIENVARHSQDDLARMKYEHRERVDEIDQTQQPLLRAITEQAMGSLNELHKAERLRTTIGDLLVVPYRRSFRTAHEAKEHADTLKTELLPKVRKIIDGYKTYKAAETVEF